jgi:integrative and conjugative element protein (TIGR02256 family)
MTVRFAERPKVWCAGAVLESLRTLAGEHSPLETGGCLAGYYARGTEDVVVTHAIGPGPRALHRRTEFVADRAFHDEVLALLWEGSQGKIRYIGDWHTHPGGSPQLSSLDRAFMRHAAKSQDAFLKYSPVAIVYGELTAVRFWSYRRARRLLGIPSRFRALEVIPYQAT